MTPSKKKRPELWNRVLLILGYDAALRIWEVTGLKGRDLHFDAEIPYIRIFEKGEKYQSVPMMKKLYNT